MKKVLVFIGNVLVVIFIAFMYLFACKNTFIYNIRDNEVYIDESTHYYHKDYKCKGIHQGHEDRTTLGTALDDGYKACHFCAE